MEKEQSVAVTHVLVLPLPVQGHINPMLQFSKRLASKAVKVTIIAFTDKELIKVKESNSIMVESVSDNSEENKKELSGAAFLQHFQALVSKNLPEVVSKQGMSGCPISCLIYDSMLPWGLDLARQLGLTAAPFFTQSCAVCTIYYKAYEGNLSIPLEQADVSIEGMPPLEVFDFPTFMYNDKHPGVLPLLISQFSNIEEADWILFNTYNSLEEEGLNWMASQCPIKPIGPTIPSKYLDKRLEDDKDYGLSLFKPNTNNLFQWLDSKKSGSVIYVSFGSMASLEEKQMEELASGLKNSNHYFLWVVRESEEQKLPQNFMEEASEKCLIVTWCPQLEVLAHNSIGCFMTHCGWNSTLEALSLGVPMVAMPQWSDQPTNAKLITDVWQVGVKGKVDANEIVTREEIEACLREVMEGDRANEIRRNAKKWKQLAKEAVDEGGSSDKNIQEFIMELACKFNIYQ